MQIGRTTERIPVADGVELAVDRWTPEPRATHASIAGGTPSSAQDGRAPAPFLLVHGLASNARLWDGVAEALVSLGHVAVTVDLRGHGRSSKPDEGYDVATVAGDLNVLIERLGLDRPIAAGQSWGGNVVLELAACRPSAVRGIALVDGGWIELSETFANLADCLKALAPPRLAGRPLAEVESWVRSAHADWPEAGIRGTLANFEVRADGTIAPWLTFDRHLLVLRGLWEHHPSARYASVRVPALLIPADDPHADSAERKRQAVEAAAAAIPASRTGWMAGDHDLHAQHPREIAELLHEMATDGSPNDPTATLQQRPARILAIMGSGETAPAMAKVHRSLFERLGDRAAPATLIDTPYGFQENADELSARIAAYFAESVGQALTMATYRSRDGDALEVSTALARIREARYVLAGPGSPSYALRVWEGTPIPAALAEKLASGGIVVVASAAALTVGVVTVPVYEIYKVGEDPRWLEGLDLLGQATGLRAAVVPHYDNAEGGTHDTRFCYLGERRLRVLEAALPKGAFVLGVDGHTALVLDLERGTASVAGLGSVTVRAAGRSVVFPSGTETTIEALAESARTIARSTGWLPGAPEGPASASSGGAADGMSARAPLPDAVAQQEGTFVEALEGRDAKTALAALLELDTLIEGRLRAGEDSPDLDGARATYRALLVRLGDAARDGLRDPHESLDPFIGALLELRSRARTAHDWTTADLIRERLTAADIEVHDDGVSSTWNVREPPGS